MLNVMLLRRIAYNLLALFRSVTQRGERERTIPCVKRHIKGTTSAPHLGTTYESFS
jgi:hypothetical protein